MFRRDLLRRMGLAAGVGTAAGLAGCLDGVAGDVVGSGDTTTTTPTTAVETRPVAELGTPPDICEEAIHEDPGIYAVTDPAFADRWAGRDVDSLYNGGDLSADDPVIGLTAGDRARAYPLAVLWYHEIVNDDFGGPVMVTFCPLCRSGMVADRLVGGTATEFLVSGLLWLAPRVQSAARVERGDVFGAGRGGNVRVQHQGNLVMYDRATRSYWSQILAKAICGPQQGEALSIRPSTFTTWGEWRAQYPDTEVLLPPPQSGIDSPPEGTTATTATNATTTGTGGEG